MKTCSTVLRATGASLFLLLAATVCHAQTTNTFPASGKAGIGTTSPAYDLDIQTPYPELRMMETASGTRKRLQLNVGTYNEIRFTSTFNSGGNYPFTFHFGAYGEAFRIAANGNVGIGTTNPQAKLAVNGMVLATEVKVKNDITVPDYVFEPDYNLPTLAEVEAHIKEHKHLPEIPSAADIQRDGLNLAEMNLLLLKKIEELTLHLIEKDRQLLQVNDRLDAVEALLHVDTKP